MGDIICICKNFPILDRYGYPTGETEFLVGAAFDAETGKAVIVPNEHPSQLGAVFDPSYGEWIIKGKE